MQLTFLSFSLIIIFLLIAVFLWRFRTKLQRESMIDLSDYYIFKGVTPHALTMQGAEIIHKQGSNFQDFLSICRSCYPIYTCNVIIHSDVYPLGLSQQKLLSYDYLKPENMQKDSRFNTYVRKDYFHKLLRDDKRKGLSDKFYKDHIKPNMNRKIDTYYR